MAYLIRVTRHFYAGTLHSGRIHYFGRYGFDTHAPIVSFESREAAKAAVAEFEDEIYLLGNGEYTRPTVRVVKASTAPQWMSIR